MAYVTKKSIPRRQSKAASAGPRISATKISRPAGLADAMDREPKPKAGSMKQMYETMTPRSGSTGHRSGNF